MDGAEVLLCFSLGWVTFDPVHRGNLGEAASVSSSRSICSLLNSLFLILFSYVFMVKVHLAG